MDVIKEALTLTFDVNKFPFSNVFRARRLLKDTFYSLKCLSIREISVYPRLCTLCMNLLGLFWGVFSGLVSFSSSELMAQHPVWDETLPFWSGLHGTRPLLLAVATGPQCQSTLGQEPELQIPLEGIATGV